VRTRGTEERERERERERGKGRETGTRRAAARTVASKLGLVDAVDAAACEQRGGRCQSCVGRAATETSGCGASEEERPGLGAREGLSQADASGPAGMCGAAAGARGGRAHRSRHGRTPGTRRTAPCAASWPPVAPSSCSCSEGRVGSGWSLLRRTHPSAFPAQTVKTPPYNSIGQVQSSRSRVPRSDGRKDEIGK